MPWGEIDNNHAPIPVKKLGRIGGEVTTYEVARAYLESMHATMWPSHSWPIRKESGADEAAAWITELVDTVNAIRNMVNVNTHGMTVQEAADDWRRTKEGL